jgi:hypothetical protein
LGASEHCDFEVAVEGDFGVSKLGDFEKGVDDEFGG